MIQTYINFPLLIIDQFQFVDFALKIKIFIKLLVNLKSKFKNFLNKKENNLNI